MRAALAVTETEWRHNIVREVFHFKYLSVWSINVLFSAEQSGIIIFSKRNTH